MAFWSEWSDGKKWIMGILSALIIAALIGLAKFILAGDSGLPKQEVPFEASSDALFAIQSSFEGTATVSGEEVEIAVAEATLSYPIRDDRTYDLGADARYIEEIRVSLVEAANGSWKPVRRSARHLVNRTIEPGAILVVDPFLLTIDVQGLESLAGYWLVFDIAERLPSEQTATGLSHSHTRSDLF